jgi:hypothetical protein
MGRSAADTPTTPEFLRASDEERDHAVDALKQEFVDGRLSHETFMLRMQTALGARNSGQLDGLFGDLPRRRSRLEWARAAVRDFGRAVAEGTAVLAEPFRGLGPSRWPAPERETERHPAEQAGSARRSGYDPAGWSDHDPGWRPPAEFAPAPTRAPRPSAPPAPLVFPPGDPSDGVGFSIGRHQGCDLYIADMSVSRLHARLARDAEGWLLTDLGSTNGTRVNGWRVWAAVPIRAGDQVRFGSAEFIVQPEPGRLGGSGGSESSESSESSDGSPGGSPDHSPGGSDSAADSQGS